MISGREALAQLEQAISGVRADEDRLDAALASATDQAARARADQAAAFRRLAELRLDTLAQAAVAGRIETVEREALDLLAEKRRQMAELGEKRRAANAALDAGQSKRHDQARRLEEIAGRIGALTEKTRARIASDAAWMAAAAAVREAEATLARARAKTEQAAADRVAKGAPYEADRLFAYLWAAGWGTSAYRGGFFAKFFDAEVARIAAYDQARPNYAMLCELPVRLKAHTEGLAAQVAAATATRTAIERAALEADGIAALEAEFAAVKAEVDAGNAGLASVQSDIATLDASHAVLVSGDDPQLDRALAKVAEGLAATDLQTLYAQAFATPTPEDEKVVREIEDLGKRVAAAEAEIAQTREVIRQTAQRRADLETARDRGRSSGWDRPGWTFGSEEALGRVIGGIVGGLVASPDLWNVLLGGMHQRPRADTWGNGGGFGGGPRVPDGGDWFGGGSSGGSSGGFGGDGGGFTTGGGFGGDGGNTTGGGF